MLAVFHLKKKRSWRMGKEAWLVMERWDIAQARILAFCH